MGRFADLRDEIAAVVADAVPEAVTYARTADSIAPPAVMVVTATPFADYQTAMGDSASARYRVQVTVLTSRVANEAGQELLDEWASPDGPIIPALFAADLVDAEVVRVTGQQYGSFGFGAAGPEYLGFSLLVEIET